MFSPLVNPSSGAPTRSIINARDALCFTGGHSRVLSLQHIILIRTDLIKAHYKDTESVRVKYMGEARSIGKERKLIQEEKKRYLTKPST